LQAALAAAQTVNAGEIAADISQRYPHQPQRIADAVRAARIAAVKKVRNSHSSADKMQPDQ
jgi:tRNA nucleotidyltransferase (CCA-adding enzyme)